jgi:hypothetical protein
MAPAELAIARFARLYGAHEFGIRDDNGYHLAFRRAVEDNLGSIEPTAGFGDSKT